MQKNVDPLDHFLREGGVGGPHILNCDRARKGSREGKTGTVLELSLEVSDPCMVDCYMGKITGR